MRTSPISIATLHLGSKQEVYGVALPFLKVGTLVAAKHRMHSFEQKLFSNCSTICHISLLSRLTARFVKTKPMFYKFILSLELLGKLWVLVMWLSLIKKQADRLISFLAHAQLMPLYKERHHNSSSSFACPTIDTFSGILWKIFIQRASL